MASAFAVALALVTNPASVAAQQAEPAWREYHTTAAAFLRSGDYRLALSILQQAREVAARDLGEDTKEYAYFNKTLAHFARRAQDQDVTAAAVARALAISEKRWGPYSEHLLEDLRDLGYARLGQGDLEGAKRAMLRAMWIVRRQFGSANIYMASYVAHVSHALLQAGELKQALGGFRAAVEYFVDNPAGARLELYGHAFAGYGAALKAAVDAGKIPADVAAKATLQAIQKLWRSKAGTAISAMAEQADARSGEREQALCELKQIRLDHDRITKRMEEIDAGWYLRRDKIVAYQRVKAAQADRSNGISNALSAIRFRASVIKNGLRRLEKQCETTPGADPCRTLDVRRKQANAELEQLQDGQSLLSKEASVLLSELEATERTLPGYEDWLRQRREVGEPMEELGKRGFKLNRQVYGDVHANPYQAQLEPKSVADIQATLRDDEAVLVPLLARPFGFAWLIRKDRIASAPITLPAILIDDGVRRLRLGLDPEQFADGIVPECDFKTAHQIYLAVFGGLESDLAGIRHLFMITIGELASLPPQVLVRDLPPADLPEYEMFRTAHWLVKDLAVSILPSLQSLVLLRSLPERETARLTYLGIANPVLNGPPGYSVRGNARRAALPPLSSLYRGGAVDVEAVRALTPLPDSENEVREIANGLGRSKGDLLIGADADEDAVKARRLSDYRVIHFATHGLTSDDFICAEPALVLTPPPKARDGNDGLPTASEIARLELNADLVVLSACNTAAGERGMDNAYSGLARAFFIAGARTLMVSHWAVVSEAAVKLMTGTFARLRSSTQLKRGEALRLAMVEAIDEGYPPFFWAPFVIVGDGGIR